MSVGLLRVVGDEVDVRAYERQVRERSFIQRQVERDAAVRSRFLGQHAQRRGERGGFSADFTADRWGDAQAERYLTGLFAGFQNLVDRPELRRPFREISPYLRALVGKHAVFYRIASNGEVLIVRVLHAVMLPALHLLNEAQDDD